jgi:hypothetical protein
MNKKKEQVPLNWNKLSKVKHRFMNHLNNNNKRKNQ